jgi:hypothetical protein
MTDPTPDAIRPEWVTAGAKALRRTNPADLQTATAMAEVVLAAVCGDIVEAARRDALREAADEVHREARWQQECLAHSGIKPGATPNRQSIDRLLIVERILRGRADTPRRPLSATHSDQDAVSRIPGSAEAPSAPCDTDGCGRIAVWLVTPTTTTVTCVSCDWTFREQVRRWVDSEGRALL